MNKELGSDAFLVRAVSNLESLLLHLTAEFDSASRAEFCHEAEFQEREIYLMGRSAINQLRSVIQDISLLASATSVGIAAKGRALQLCIASDFRLEDDLMDLVKSLAQDIENVLHVGLGCACQSHLFPISNE